jgi:hypothetical protein
MIQLCRKTQQSKSDLRDHLISHRFLRDLSGVQICAARLELDGECILQYCQFTFPNAK